MKKMRVKTMDGGEKSVRVHRVGLVTWNGVTGELKIDAEDGYMAVTKAVASLMLVGDQVVNLAIPRAEIYPVYGNENAVSVALTVVSANAGEVRAHDPDFLKLQVSLLGDLVTQWGFMKPLPDENQTVLALTPKESVQ